VAEQPSTVAAALPEPISPSTAAVRRRKWRRPVNAKAQRQRMIKAHNYRLRGRA
jgi:hypothetical protein